MLILSVDTTATVCSAALRRDGKTLGECTVNSGNTHSVTLLPMIEQLLKFCNAALDDIDIYAASVGPGSFTGVRIGTAAVKGLAYKNNVPCVPVSSLEALAYNLVELDGIICPAMNARRDQVYTALFSSDGKNLTRMSEDMAVSAEELGKAISAFDKNVYFCGDGYDLVCGFGKLETPERLRLQSAASVAAVAENIWNKTEDKSIFTPDALLPVYLRKPQAERERDERLRAAALAAGASGTAGRR